MSIRGRELYIIAAVVIVVICVAWYFLLFAPTRSKLDTLDSQIEQNEQTLSSAKQNLARLESYKKTAPQNKADLVRLNKLMPSETGIPSFIISLSRTASASGLDLIGVTPGEVVPGTPFGVQPVNLTFTGHYFDFEDFLYRLENYVDYRNENFLVTGRMFEVTTFALAPVTESETSASLASPSLQVTLTVNGYLWSATAAAAAPAGAQ